VITTLVTNKETSQSTAPGTTRPVLCNKYPPVMNWRYTHLPGEGDFYYKKKPQFWSKKFGFSKNIYFNF
jgi:hypothetical protein